MWIQTSLPDALSRALPVSEMALSTTLNWYPVALSDWVDAGMCDEIWTFTRLACFLPLQWSLRNLMVINWIDFFAPKGDDEIVVKKIDVTPEKQRVLAKLSHDVRTPLIVIEAMSISLSKQIELPQVYYFVEATNFIIEMLTDIINEHKNWVCESWNDIESLSHVFKSIVANMANHALDLSGRQDLEEYRDDFFLIFRTSSRVIQLIDSLWRPSLGVFNFLDIVNHQVELFQKKLSSDVNLNLRVEKGISWDVQSYNMIFERVISNILSNAVKFTWKWSIDISISRWDVPWEYLINISDTWIWMSHKDLSMIFKAYKQASDAAEYHKLWSGLWLSIVKSYVKNLFDWEIDVFSKPWRWTTFSLRLNMPYAKWKMYLRSMISKLPKRDIQTPEVLRNFRVLIVDDDRDMVILMKKFLKEKWFDCQVAYSAHEAAEVLESWHVHAIVTDVGLEGSASWTILTKELLRQFPDYLVVALTWNGSDDYDISTAWFAKVITKDGDSSVRIVNFLEDTFNKLKLGD